MPFAGEYAIISKDFEFARTHNMRSVKFVEFGRLFISDKNKEKKMLLSSKMVNRTHIMRRSFTLIELLVVIAIIAILAACCCPP